MVKDMIKKLCVAVIALICLISCTSNTVDNTSNSNINAEKFEYEQHSYIMFYTVTGHITGVEHDPNCWCMIDYD